MHGVEYIRSYQKTLPPTPGVYRMFDEKDQVLYVGKARALSKRVLNYTQLDRLPPRLQRMVMQTVRMEVVNTRTEAEALLLEANLIKSLKPRYNILLRDDKSFPYITLTDHAFPRLTKHRGERKEGQDYFGPYPSAGAVNDTITTLQKLFQIRPCSDSFFNSRTRPCMEYQIKRCTAPCVRLVNETEYAEQTKQARAFLQGKKHEVQASLQAKMDEASSRMEYEMAAFYRDKIQALSSIQATQGVNDPTLGDADVIAIAEEAGQVGVSMFLLRGGLTLGTQHFYPKQTEGFSKGDILETLLGHFYQRHEPPPLILLSEDLPARAVLQEALTSVAKRKVEVTIPLRGTKRTLVEAALLNATEALTRKLQENVKETALLEKVAEIFGIGKPLERIEVFDNSHIFGQHAVGGMIVAGQEGFMPQSYRLFNVDAGEKKTGGDDFWMMQQVLTRRYGRLKREGATLPDLILIDGGAGQLSVAIRVMQELGLSDIPLVAIAKGPDRNAGREEFHQPGKAPFTLPSNDSALYYLQRLRDEAHRFAITGHRKKRSKSTSISTLDAIQGIGAKRKKALLMHFGSARAVEEATTEELAKVEFINKKTAKVIYDALHQGN